MDHWYAARVKPGMQRIAAGEDRDDNEGASDKRRFEYVIERQCRRRGIESFTPSFWTRVQHARTKRLLTKRYPFLTGYVFVNLPTFEFERLRKDVHGVSYVLCGGNGPIEFRSSTIDQLRINDWKERTTFERDVHHFDEELRLKAIGRLRGALRSIMPKGRAVRVNIEEEKEIALERLPARTRERVLTIMAQIKALEAPLEEFAEAV